ncbi:MAG: 2-isopropylmalate synthase [Candidatus Sumerlaeia bacterium]
MTKNRKTQDRVIIFDTTLRDGEQAPGCSMNLKEKLEIAAQLARLGVDVIEAGFPIASVGDFEAVHAVSAEIQGPVIAGLARSRDVDIRRAAEALEPAIERGRGRIHTFIATSPIHMEKKLQMTPDEVIEAAVEAVRLARSFTPDVEFSCEDAGRSERDFLVRIVSAVIEAGATTINIPDTVGYVNPWEFGDTIEHLIKNCRGASKAVFSVHCHNDLGMAVANSLAAVKRGARQVECTINGLGERAGNASLEEIVMNLHTRRDYYGVTTGINTREIFRTSRLVSRVVGFGVQPNKAIVGANAFAHEAGIHQHGVLRARQTYEIMQPEDVGWSGDSLVLGKHSGRHALRDRVEQLGIRLQSEEDFERLFVRFKDLCDKKKEIFDEDLFAIVDDEFMRPAEVFHLVRLWVDSDTEFASTAKVKLARGGQEFKAEAQGDGPVDAAYKAIDAVTGQKPRLLEYQITAVTGGKDAVGKVNVRVQIGELVGRGRGASTDIIEASAKAYLNAVNQILLNQAESEKDKARQPAGI